MPVLFLRIPTHLSCTTIAKLLSLRTRGNPDLMPRMLSFALLTCSLLLKAEIMPNVFASEDAKALLTVVSKLHPLVVVPPSKFSDFEEPQICWMDDVRSRILNQVLLQYKGALNWMLIADLPRSCLVASVSFFDPGATPSPMDFRTVAVRDLQHLAEFLNDRLGLKTKPSLGIKYSEESIDLPGIEDQTGPGGGICLVADPIEFSRNLQV